MRPIDADALEKAALKPSMFDINKDDVIALIAEMPTLNVVPREEVVRIFAEIDSTIDLICAMTGVDIAIFGKYAELKKKYTEEKK